MSGHQDDSEKKEINLYLNLIKPFKVSPSYVILVIGKKIKAKITFVILVISSKETIPYSKVHRTHAFR